MTRRVVLYIIGMWSVALLASGCGGTAPSAEMAVVDSLNQSSYAAYYRDAYEAGRLAEQAYAWAAHYHAGRAEAANHLGYCAFMRSDYAQAEQWIDQAGRLTSNELERFIADVGQMKICQRTARNKDYYDARHRALRRMRRLLEDITVFTEPHEKRRLHFAFSEFYAVSALYAYGVQQHPRAVGFLEDMSEWSSADTVQNLRRMIFRGGTGLMSSDSLRARTAGCFDWLYWGVRQSRVGGYRWLEAYCLRCLSELLVSPAADLLPADRRMRLADEGGSDTLLPYRLAVRSVELFRRHGDVYQTAEALRTLAMWLNRNGRYVEAVDTLDVALSALDGRGALASDSLPVPSDTARVAYEAVARIHEQLSVAYAGLGRKDASDYHRNCYLDILYHIRQDRELESRYQTLRREASQLNWLILLVVGAVGLACLTMGLLSRFWRRRGREEAIRLRALLDLCRNVVAPLPADVSDSDEVARTVENRIFPFMQRWLEVDSLQIEVMSSRPEEKSGKGDAGHAASFPLAVVDDRPAVGVLRLVSVRPWTKERRAVVQLVIPVMAWVLENGQAMLLLHDRARQVEKQRYVNEQHVEENKRRNVEKKACLSLVEGVKPFIDRMMGEVTRLQQARYASNREVRAAKYQYIRELAERIQEYNDILAQWIQLKQGTLSLSVENFPLDELMEVVAKRRRTFEARRQTLEVEPTRAVVKADKALTLFMINTLTENARKYTPDGGRIRLYAREEETYVEVSVEDNGRGLSESDMHRILDEKVYDSSRIGLGGTDDASLRKAKGSGFGLMNCKGIIEKYRKTNPLFSVCLFGIESRLGEGSRFFFRLPKGIWKTFGWLLVGLCAVSCTARTPAASECPVPVLPDSVADRWLDTAAAYADRVYEANVEGCHAQAVEYAESALHCLNVHRRMLTGQTDTLHLRGVDAAVEAMWWQEGFASDYHVLLDVRNEAAVAFLALKDWNAYIYNNEAYATLSKLVSEDTSLEAYCRRLQQATSHKQAGFFVCALLLGAVALGYAIFFVGRRTAGRRRLEQLLEADRLALCAVSAEGADETRSAEAVLRGLLDACREPFGELLSLDGLWLAATDVEHGRLCVVSTLEASDADLWQGRLEACFRTQQSSLAEEDHAYLSPLLTGVDGETGCVGVLAWTRLEEEIGETDRLLTDLLTRQLALVVLNALVNPAAKLRAIEWAEDELRRAAYEDGQLHVQNLVLDNCFSALKHETVYYPNRIRQIADRLERTDVPADESTQVEAMRELISYYSDVYTLLSSCASRQLSEVMFRRTSVPVDEAVAHMGRYMERAVRRQSVRLRWRADVSEPGMQVSADRIELHFLLETLADEALSVGMEGDLQLSVRPDGAFVRFEWNDSRCLYTDEQLQRLFYPQREWMRPSADGRMTGTAYLIAKQIIRDHDEYGGRRGCRIEAKACDGGGFCVCFTLLRTMGRRGGK